MNMQFDYLSDQALEELIACSEEQGLLSAPRTMKAEILAQAQTAQPPEQKPSQQKQFIAYCLRVAMATAACLVMLFAGGKSVGQFSQSALSSTAQRFSAFTDQLEEGYQDINQKLSQFFINFDFGGNRHE